MYFIASIFILFFTFSASSQSLTEKDAHSIARGEWVMQQLSVNEFISEASPKLKKQVSKKYPVVIFQEMKTGKVIQRDFKKCEDVFKPIRLIFQKEKVGHSTYPLTLGYQEYLSGSYSIMDFGLSNCKSFLKNLKRYQNEDSISYVSEILSLVGPWVSISTKFYEQRKQTKPQKIESWYTYDLRTRLQVSLDKLVSTQSLLKALNKSSLKKKKKFKNLTQVKKELGPGFLKAYALANFYQKPNLLEVRIATESNHIKHKDQKMSYVSLKVVPTPKALSFLKDALREKGFFMKNRPLIKRHQ